MDLNQKGSVNSSSPASEVQVKTCSFCQTTRTPLWRGGPAGPKSLCNACGIRHRKQRRALLGLTKGGSEKIKKKNHISTTNTNITTAINGNRSGCNEMGITVNLVDLGREMALKRSWPLGRKKMMKLREEEEAAMLLMALSCGSVFA